MNKYVTAIVAVIFGATFWDLLKYSFKHPGLTGAEIFAVYGVEWVILIAATVVLFWRLGKPGNRY